MSSSKKISLPKAKGSGTGKLVVLLLLGIGLYCVITDPAGSSENVNSFFDSLGTFAASLRGGGW